MRIFIVHRSAQHGCATIGADLADFSYRHEGAPPIPKSKPQSASRFAPGFLPGTLIEAADSIVMVESLRAGHRIMTVSHGARQPRPVHAIDCHHVAAPTAGNDAYLVRIHSGAFAPGIPGRDLILTGGHGILVDDSVVAARTLINGRSIERHPWVSACMQYRVRFQAETIIFAEGLPTQCDVEIAHPLDAYSRDNGGDTTGCVSLTDEVSAAIWQALDRRADAIGFAPAPPAGRLDVPDIALRLDTGDLLRPHRIDGARHVFHLPYAARAVQLISRVASRRDATEAEGDDPGSHGVAVCRIALWNGLSEMVVEAAQFEGAGWQELHGDHRRTDDCASLSMPAAINADTYMEIQLATQSQAAATIQAASQDEAPAIPASHGLGTRVAA